ncbi:MAG: hypothetical protein AB1540_10385 [Bdellovibrionota bacterium]
MRAYCNDRRITETSPKNKGLATRSHLISISVARAHQKTPNFHRKKQFFLFFLLLCILSPHKSLATQTKESEHCEAALVKFGSYLDQKTLVQDLLSSGIAKTEFEAAQLARASIADHLYEAMAPELHEIIGNGVLHEFLQRSLHLNKRGLLTKRVRDAVYGGLQKEIELDKLSKTESGDTVFSLLQVIGGGSIEKPVAPESAVALLKLRDEYSLRQLSELPLEEYFKLTDWLEHVLHLPDHPFFIEAEQRLSRGRRFLGWLKNGYKILVRRPVKNEALSIGIDYTPEKNLWGLASYKFGSAYFVKLDAVIRDANRLQNSYFLARYAQYLSKQQLDMVSKSFRFDEMPPIVAERLKEQRERLESALKDLEVKNMLQSHLLSVPKELLTALSEITNHEPGKLLDELLKTPAAATLKSAQMLPLKKAFSRRTDLISKEALETLEMMAKPEETRIELKPRLEAVNKEINRLERRLGKSEIIELESDIKATDSEIAAFKKIEEQLQGFARELSTSPESSKSPYGKISYGQLLDAIYRWNMELRTGRYKVPAQYQAARKLRELFNPYSSSLRPEEFKTAVEVLFQPIKDYWREFPTEIKMEFIYTVRRHAQNIAELTQDSTDSVKKTIIQTFSLDLDPSTVGADHYPIYTYEILPSLSRSWQPRPRPTQEEVESDILTLQQLIKSLESRRDFDAKLIKEHRSELENYRKEKESIESQLKELEGK